MPVPGHVCMITEILPSFEKLGNVDGSYIALKRAVEQGYARGRHMLTTENIVFLPSAIHPVAAVSSICLLLMDTATFTQSIKKVKSKVGIDPAGVY